MAMAPTSSTARAAADGDACRAAGTTRHAGGGVCSAGSLSAMGRTIERIRRKKKVITGDNKSDNLRGTVDDVMYGLRGRANRRVTFRT
jgi:hypothetical protein